MSITLVERLRELSPAPEGFGRPDITDALVEAAAEIKRLEGEVRAANEAVARLANRALEAAGLAKPAPFMGER